MVGTEGDWARVLHWEPPHRLVLAWKPNTRPVPPTELEIRFTSVDEGTRVELEHRGWERLGARGEESRAEYASGWLGALERFVSAAEG